MLKLKRSLLNFDLRRIVDSNFRNISVVLYQTRGTYTLVPVLRFWRSKLPSVTAPNHNRKNLTRVRLVQVQERRLSICAFSIPSTCDGTANGCNFPDIVLCFL